MEPDLNHSNFDAILAKIENQTIGTIIFIEAKGTKEVDNNYREYKDYISDALPLKGKILNIITSKYPDLNIDPSNIELLFGILIPDKRKNNWIASLTATQENIFLYARYEDKDTRLVSFKLEWKPFEIDASHPFSVIESFFINSPQLCTSEFEMFNSLDSLYNLDLLMHEYNLKYPGKEINDNLCKEIIKRKSKSEYYESAEILDHFLANLKRIGPKYNLIYCRGLDKKFYFRQGENGMIDQFTGFHLKERLEENDNVKKKILENIVNELTATNDDSAPTEK